MAHAFLCQSRKTPMGPPAHDPRDARQPFVNPHVPRPAAHGWHRQGHATGGGEGVFASLGSMSPAKRSPAQDSRVEMVPMVCRR